jgi:hypothetical protein
VCGSQTQSGSLLCVHFLLFFWEGLDGRRSFYKGRVNSPVSWRVSRHFLFGASHNLNLCWQQLLLLVLTRKRGAVGNRLGPSLRHWVADSIRFAGRKNDDRNEFIQRLYRIDVGRENFGILRFGGCARVCWTGP